MGKAQARLPKDLEPHGLTRREIINIADQGWPHLEDAIEASQEVGTESPKYIEDEPEKTEIKYLEIESESMPDAGKVDGNTTPTLVAPGDALV